MKCQILFTGKIRKQFKNVVCRKIKKKRVLSVISSSLGGVSQLGPEATLGRVLSQNKLPLNV